MHWHGHIVPFHSVETIIQAAEILKDEPDIEFQIITRFNSKYQQIKKLTVGLNLKNIKFYPETDYFGLAKYINKADVCLGIFGNNKKAQLVIPNKIIEAVACAKPIITGGQVVLNEIFKDEENIFMVEPGDSRGLANKILELKNNLALSKKISQNAYLVYLNKLKPKVVVKKMLLKI